MKKKTISILLLIFVLAFVACVTGCNNVKSEDETTYAESVSCEESTSVIQNENPPDNPGNQIMADYINLVGENEYNSRERFYNQTVSAEMAPIIAKASDDDVIEFGVRVSGEQNYVYQGRTVGEYLNIWKNEEEVKAKLSELILKGEYLKYGEKICESDNSSGKKWTVEFYESTMERLGEDFVSQYIVDGVFLKEKAEADYALTTEDARKMYEEALNESRMMVYAVLQSALQEQNILSEYVEKSHNQFGNYEFVKFSATKKEFFDVITLPKISMHFSTPDASFVIGDMGFTYMKYLFNSYKGISME